MTIVQLVGYTTGLLFIHHTTGMTPPGVSAQYRGSDSTVVVEAAMKFPKSYAEMLNLTHTHLLSMAAIFAFSGLALALCERPAGAGGACWWSSPSSRCSCRSRRCG